MPQGAEDIVFALMWLIVMVNVLFVEFLVMRTEVYDKVLEKYFRIAYRVLFTIMCAFILNIVGKIIVDFWTGWC